MKEIVQNIAVQMQRFLNALGSTQDRVEELESLVADLSSELQATRRAIIMLEPRYHTALHTFDSVSEARMAWALLNMTLSPRKYQTHESVPEMPMGRAYVAPWDPEPDKTITQKRETIMEKYGENA